jgi:hypothetical protein
VTVRTRIRGRSRRQRAPSAVADAEPGVRTAGSEGIAQLTRSVDKGVEMPVWAWILIILLIVFLLGGFGYSRR